MKRVKPFVKYAALADKLFKFFCNIRDANGAVTKGLLQAYVVSLPDEIKKDFLSVNRTSQEDFWKRWQTAYGLTHRGCLPVIPP